MDSWVARAGGALVASGERGRTSDEDASQTAGRDALVEAGGLVFDMDDEGNGDPAVILGALRARAQAATRRAKQKPGSAVLEGERRGWWRAMFLVEKMNEHPREKAEERERECGGRR